MKNELITGIMSSIQKDFPEDYDGLNGLSIMGLGDTVLVCVDDEAPVTLLGEVRSRMEDKGLKVSILIGRDEGLDSDETMGDEVLGSLLMESYQAIKEMSIVDTSGTMPNIGTVFLLSEDPTEEEMAELKENVYSLGADGNFHRIILAVGDGILEIIDLNKEGKTAKVDKIEREPAESVSTSTRPDREKIIQKGEITDLKISLEVSEDVLDFLKSLEG